MKTRPEPVSVVTGGMGAGARAANRQQLCHRFVIDSIGSAETFSPASRVILGSRLPLFKGIRHGCCSKFNQLSSTGRSNFSRKLYLAALAGDFNQVMTTGRRPLISTFTGWS
jgi:hypothetical protein